MSLSWPKSPLHHWSHYLLPPFFWFPCFESKLWSLSSWAHWVVRLWGVTRCSKEYETSQKILACENGTEPSCTEFWRHWATLSMMALGDIADMSDAGEEPDTIAGMDEECWREWSCLFLVDPDMPPALLHPCLALFFCWVMYISQSFFHISYIQGYTFISMEPRPFQWLSHTFRQVYL